MTHDIARRCGFRTERLSVGDWRRLSDRHGLDLVDVISEVLTPATTIALPPEWQGEFDRERAACWMEARDTESPTLLVVEAEAAMAVGLMILFESADRGNGDRIDVRLGYVLAEEAWGRGLATELVAGLVTWARSEPSIGSVSAGVADGNEASVRVLVKTGFELAGSRSGERFYSVAVGPSQSGARLRSD